MEKIWWVGRCQWLNPRGAGKQPSGEVVCGLAAEVDRTNDEDEDEDEDADGDGNWWPGEGMQISLNISC